MASDCLICSDEQCDKCIDNTIFQKVKLFDILLCLNRDLLLEFIKAK